MRQYLLFISFFLGLLVKGKLVRAQAAPSFSLVTSSSQKLPVTLHKMTSLVFPLPIRAGIKVSRDVLVQKVKGVDNVLELKALRSRFVSTNLSVFGMDGRLYSFDLEYADSAPALNFAICPLPATRVSSSRFEQMPVLLTGLPVDQGTLTADAASLAAHKGFLQASVHNEKMRLNLKGIYLRDSLLWFVLTLHNHSRIPYHPAYVRLFSLDRRKVKRMAIQQAAIEPVYSDPPEIITGRTNRSFAIGFPLFTLAQDKTMILEVAERNGGRLLKLPISYKTLLKGRPFR